ncbi:MAG TPA: FtsX-like permease family protein [Methanothrix sp.]|nr:FtsX-like permease family protein [Methanothrix sp.]
MPALPSIIPDFERSVVMRHIVYRKRGTFLSVAAIALAVAISLISVSMQDGFQGMLFDIIVEDLPHVTVTPREGDDYIYLYKSLMDRVWSIPGVVAVSPGLGTQVTFTYKDNVESVAMSGVNPADLDRIYHIGQYFYKGDLASIQNGKKVVLSEKLADRLKVKLGQTVYASIPDERGTSLMVSGIFKLPTGWPEDIAFVSLTTVRDLLGKGDVVSSVEIKLEDVYLADGVAANLQGYGYKAESWQTLYPDILETLAIEEFQNRLIMLLILIIAAFGIGSVMYMLVNEKTSEIGMFMAMGASGKNIRNIFLMESGILGIMGGLLGAVLGLLVALYLQSLEIKMDAPGGQEISLPVVINAGSFLGIVVVAAALSVIAGMYPAWKASRLDPALAING